MALDGGPHANRILVRDSLTHLWADPDLAGLLDREPLDELSAAERQEGHALWSEIDALIRARSSHQLRGRGTGVLRDWPALIITVHFTLTTASASRRPRR